MPKDPVCLMEVGEDSGFRKRIGDKTYYFCSRFCLDKFTEKPGNYLARHGDLLGGKDAGSKEGGQEG